MGLVAVAAAGCGVRSLSGDLSTVNGGSGGAAGSGGQPDTTGSAGVGADPTGAGNASGTGGSAVPQPMPASAIAAGHYHSCALMADATVRCWGLNYGGMIGDGNSGNVQLTPVSAVGLSGVTDVFASYTLSGARVSDGTWRCWGSNNYGQLGDGTTTERDTPAPILAGLAVQQLSLGVYHSCVLLTDGTVRCYGSNYAGQLGDGTTVDRATPAPPNPALTGVVQIAAGAIMSCAVHDGGTVSCWGSNALGGRAGGTGTMPVRGITGAMKVVVGGNVACVLVAGGSVSCWGSNSYGQVGDGTTIDRATPTPVPGLSGVVDLVAGMDHVCALLPDRTVTCWGHNSNGQLGDGTTTDRPSPTPVPGLADVAQLSLGVTHSCALLTSGAILCWGDEYALVRDQVPNDPYTMRLRPAPIAF